MWSLTALRSRCLQPGIARWFARSRDRGGIGFVQVRRRLMTQARAGLTKIVRGNGFKHHAPDHLGTEALSPDLPGLVDRAKHRARRDPCCLSPRIRELFMEVFQRSGSARPNARRTCISTLGSSELGDRRFHAQSVLTLPSFHHPVSAPFDPESAALHKPAGKLPTTMKIREVA
jgi:hypothetical protein